MEIKDLLESEYGAEVKERIPLLKIVNFETLDNKSKLHVAKEIFFMGASKGEKWLINQPIQTSRDLIELYREFISKSTASLFHHYFYVWYPYYRNLSYERLLMNLDAFIVAIQGERARGNKAYLTHNERVMLRYFKDNSQGESRVVVDPESDYFRYVKSRLGSSGVLHLIDEVDGEIYSCILTIFMNELTITGRIIERR